MHVLAWELPRVASHPFSKRGAWGALSCFVGRPLHFCRHGEQTHRRPKRGRSCENKSRIQNLTLTSAGSSPSFPVPPPSTSLHDIYSASKHLNSSIDDHARFICINMHLQKEIAEAIQGLQSRLVPLHHRYRPACLMLFGLRQEVCFDSSSATASCFSFFVLIACSGEAKSRACPLKLCFGHMLPTSPAIFISNPLQSILWIVTLHGFCNRYL